ncbi:MAG: TIGR02588 family protein [Chloroflexota bacterium]|nr:TIGR02588 family protein [Chloroflexota bacterium]
MTPDNDRDAPRKGQGNHQQTGERGRDDRSVAEWITFAISAALILGVVGLASYLYVSGGNSPPIIETETLVDELRRANDEYYLPIAVTNVGDETAEQVQIQVRLAPGAGQPETSEFMIQFLAGGETVQGTAVFSADPLAGDLAVDVVGFQRP